MNDRTPVIALHFSHIWEKYNAITYMFFRLLQFVMILFGYFLFGFIFGHLSVHFWSQHEQFSWWAFPVPVELKDTGTHTREWEDHSFAIKTNTFCSRGKYILQSGQIFLQLEQIQFSLGTNTFSNWDKYILLLGQTHFLIGTNLDKHILLFWCLWAERHRVTHQSGKIIKRMM